MANGLIPDYYSTPEVKQAIDTSSSYSSAASLLPDKLKEAIQGKLDYNKDIIAEQSQAQANYFSAPSTARAKYADPSSPDYVFNPFTAEKLVSQYVSNAYAPYATLSNVLKERRGDVSSVIDSASKLLTGQAGVAKNNLDTILSLAKARSDQAQWAYEQTHAKPSSAAGSTPFEKAMQNALAMSMGIDPVTGMPIKSPASANAKPTEEKPTINASSLSRNVRWHSPGGQWVWDWQTFEWVPDMSAIM